VALYDWKREFSVGVDLFDSHHRKLIDLINSLHGAMSKGQSQKVVNGIVAELAAYTRYHFAEEEQRMNRYHYSGYRTHKAEHEVFIVKVEGFIVKLDAGGVGLPLSLLKFLGDWLISHIQKTDKQYSAFFSANPVM